jgi:hypothetical protein
LCGRLACIEWWRAARQVSVAGARVRWADIG